MMSRDAYSEDTIKSSKCNESLEVCSSQYCPDDHELALASSNDPLVMCPLHTALRELAYSAVKQHVLLLEGECCPRLELLQTVEKWSSLATLMYSRICPASRASSISPAELKVTLDALIPTATEATTPPLELHLRTMCFACAKETSCPLGKEI